MAVSLMLVDDDPLALASLTQTLRRHLPTAIVEAFGDPYSGAAQVPRSAICCDSDGL